jgi:serine/threonine protein kinase
MKHIIVVDDEKDFLKYMKIVLEKHGYKVTPFDEGRKALSYMKESHVSPEKPDLLITDLAMPDIDGLKLLDELKKDGISTPAMIVTGVPEREPVVEALRRGCKDYVDKPLEIDDFIGRVRSVTMESAPPKEDELKTQIFQKKRSIGNYKLLKMIGEGANGMVFLCENADSGEKFAMKILRVNVTKNDNEKKTAMKSFINESNAISQLNHPNIIDFKEFGYSGQGIARRPYIVMEYIDGESLASYIDNPGRLDIKDKIHIIRQIADALDSVHLNNVFHRDIKPENILVDKSLNIKITDFGVCHLPSTDDDMEADIFGTPRYIAPEYLKKGKADHRCDIYSLGVVAYELFVGRLPFEDATGVKELINKTLEEYPDEPKKVIPDFPVDLQSILAKMLKKKPKKRYSRASHIVADLDRLSFKDGELPVFEKLLNVLEKDWK